MARTHSANTDFFFCPVCHTELPVTAKVCPECGSDKDTGWKDLDQTPMDEDFDYDEFVAKEFGDKKSVKPKGIPFWVWLTAAALAGFLILGILKNFFRN